MVVKLPRVPSRLVWETNEGSCVDQFYVRRLEALALEYPNAEGVDFARIPTDRSMTAAVLSHLPRNLKVLHLNSFVKMADDGLSVGGGVWRDSQGLPAGLKYLGLPGCTDITDEGLCQLEGLKDLYSLDLSSCKITGKTFDRLPKSVRELDLKGCPNITDESLRFLPPNLLKLSLYACRLVCECAHGSGSRTRG